MATVDTLRKGIDRMIKQIEPRIIPKEWTLIAEQGQEIPAHILAQIGIYDSVLIREIPRQYFGDDMGLPVAWCR